MSPCSNTPLTKINTIDRCLSTNVAYLLWSLPTPNVQLWTKIDRQWLADRYCSTVVWPVHRSPPSRALHIEHLKHWAEIRESDWEVKSVKPGAINFARTDRRSGIETGGRTNYLTHYRIVYGFSNQQRCSNKGLAKANSKNSEQIAAQLNITTCCKDHGAISTCSKHTNFRCFFLPFKESHKLIRRNFKVQLFWFQGKMKNYKHSDRSAKLKVRCSVEKKVYLWRVLEPKVQRIVKSIGNIRCYLKKHGCDVLKQSEDNTILTYLNDSCIR